MNPAVKGSVPLASDTGSASGQGRVNAGTSGIKN
jgi:hypothetical protein